MKVITIEVNLMVEDDFDTKSMDEDIKSGGFDLLDGGLDEMDEYGPVLGYDTTFLSERTEENE